MAEKMILRAGTPDDDNRDYLPEEILGTDIVVNENGNNSHPWSPKLKEFHDTLDGFEGTWYEYVPESYDPAKKVPLVISLHGGVMTGWGQFVYSSWSMLADKEGFIVAYPNAHANRFWAMLNNPDYDAFFKGKSIGEFTIPKFPEKIEDDYDAQFLNALITHLSKKYNIDTDRIFMQGMSNGCGMTNLFARFFGGRLAGAACSAGPGSIKWLVDEKGGLINAGGPLDMWESHPEFNGSLGMTTAKQETQNVRESRYYWLKINECAPVPQIAIDGEDNYAFFSGKKADYTFLDIKNRDHGQTLNEAFLYWDYFFANAKRNSKGGVDTGETSIPRKGDANAAAFEPGVAKVWWHNQVKELSQAPLKWQKLKYHGLNGGQKVRGEYTMVPAKFLAEMAGGEYLSSKDTLTAEIRLPDGRTCQFARGSIGCLIDDSLRSMYCEALHRNGELLVSVEWFVKCILNMQTSWCNDVLYVTDHFAELSFFMADLIKCLFKDRVLPADWHELGKNLGENSPEKD